jgi:sulfonate transport system permease protein
MTGVRDGVRAHHRWLAAALVALVIAGWQAAHVLAGTNQAGESMVPGAHDVIRAAKDLSREWPGGLGVGRTDEGTPETWRGAVLAFGYHAGATGLRMSAGFLLGVLVGMTLAALVSWSPRIRRLVYVPAHTMRMLPLLAVIPLFGLWFGNSDVGAVLFIAFTVFVQVFTFGVNAIANVPAYFEQSARSLGAGRLRAYLQVILPAASPELGSGLSLALVFGWTAAISAEFNGQQSGLGHIAYLAQYFSHTGMLALMAVVVIAFAAVSFLLARRVMRWATRWAE